MTEQAAGAQSSSRSAPHEYVYGVVRSGTPAPRQDGGIGGTRVRAIEFGKVAALGSPVDGERIRATRRDLKSHSEVLTQALSAGQVLPLRFGTVFEDADAVVAELLQPRHDELAALLERFEGVVELSVKAFYSEQKILAEVVAQEPQIARLREATRLQPEAATHGLRFRLGEAVAHAVEARRRHDAERIVSELRRLALDLVVDDQQVENLVLKASLLVQRSRLNDVDARMDELARDNADRIQFKYVGPLPPHSFVSLENNGPR